MFGVGGTFAGIRFPVRSQYVFLLCGGAGASYSGALRGSGLLTEVAGLTSAGLLVSGMLFDVLIGPGMNEPSHEHSIAAPAGHGASGSW